VPVTYKRSSSRLAILPPKLTLSAPLHTRTQTTQVQESVTGDGDYQIPLAACGELSCYCVVVQHVVNME
jgi:hypothetical protein